MRRGRNGRTRSVSSALSLFSQVLALAAGRPVFTADYYAVDGVSGKVASFIDWNDPTHTLAQASSSLQVAIPAAHADYGGKLCANFTGAEYYDSTRPTGWAFTSNGTPNTFYWAATATDTTFGYLWNTRGTQVGLGVTTLSGPDRVSVVVGNDTINTLATTAAAGVNVPINGRFSYTENITTPEFALKVTGQTAVTGDSAAAPTATNPGVFRIGFRATASPSLPGKFRLRSLVFTPEPRVGSLVPSWIQSDTGIAP